VLYLYINSYRRNILKKDLVTKPNQLIEIVGNISGVQTKMYNVILARAHQLLKIKNQEEFILNLSDILKSAGIKNKNYNQVRKYLSELLKTSIEYMDSKGDWGGFNLISSYKKVGDDVKIGLPREIRMALIESNYYSTLDLLIMSNLEGKHAITLYEIAIKYHKVQIPEYSIEEFRKITNTSKSKSYDNFARLKTKVIIPAIEEINKQTDINLSYSIRKIGRKVEFIKFKVEPKTNRFTKVTFSGNENHTLSNYNDTGSDNENYLTIKEELNKKDNKIDSLNINATFSGNYKDTISDKIEKCVIKAKRNIYISKAWNKRVETKISKLLKENGEEYTLDILNRLYTSVKQEIKTTLVQYINGIMKNIKEEEKEKQVESKKVEVKNDVEIEVRPKKKEVTKVISNKLLPNEEITLEWFESLNEEKKKELEENAVKVTIDQGGMTAKFLRDTKNRSFKIYFNMIKGNLKK
jgi:hypothetical protein